MIPKNADECYRHKIQTSYFVEVFLALIFEQVGGFGSDLGKFPAIERGGSQNRITMEPERQITYKSILIISRQ